MLHVHNDNKFLAQKYLISLPSYYSFIGNFLPKQKYEPKLSLLYKTRQCSLKFIFVLFLGPILFSFQTFALEGVDKMLIKIFNFYLIFTKFIIDITLSNTNCSFNIVQELSVTHFLYLSCDVHQRLCIAKVAKLGTLFQRISPSGRFFL